MPLTPGATLGPYKVIAKIGEGGMGEVYQARDAKLDRDVALKVLPEAFTADPDRLARFEREAKVLASLNHQNIGGIHGLEDSGDVRALVLELIEGPTLADRIKQGPIPFDEALPIARQIADALEAAHERGVIHRDLKPANVKVKTDGTVKVLDFGLAKAMQPEATQADAAASPTLSMTAVATQMGMVMGTAAYMAPEQAKGLPVDKRADVWAFGVVLFEMLTGKKLFEAGDVSEMIASVLVKDPDISSVGRHAPAAVVSVLRRCLVKDPKRRLRDIGDARLLLDESEQTPAVPVSETKRTHPDWMWPGLAAAGVATALGVSAYHALQPAPPPAAAVTFEVSEPERIGGFSAVSPDGRHLVFPARATEQGGRELRLRSLDGLESRALTGTRGVRPLASAVAWSPDSRSVVFITPTGLHRTDLESDLSVELVSTGSISSNLDAAAWGPEGTILYALDGADPADIGIWSVPSAGGEPRRLVQGEGAVPVAFLPDRRFLYGALSFDGRWLGEIRVGSLDAAPEDQDPTVLLRTESAVAFVPGTELSSTDAASDLLVFVRQGRLVAQPFDAATATLVGDPMRIADGVGAFSTASPQALSFIPGGGDIGTQSRLVVFDRDGQQLEVVGAPADYGAMDMAGSGRQLVVGRTDPGEPQHIQILDLTRGAFTPLNPGSNGDYAAAPSPDGTIAYTSSPDAMLTDIYVRAANGVGEPRALVTSATTKHANDWSPDGRWVIYDDHRSGMAQDLFIVSADAGDPIPFLTTEADETLAGFSPDGQWIVYMSDESGRNEVYVRDFAPDQVPAYGTERVLISVDGGDKPRWSRDGREIFFIDPSGILMAVPVTPGVPFEVGTPTRLFQTSFRSYVPYDVMPDGNFIVNALVDPSGAETMPIVVMLNWQSLLGH